jgi:threonine-phosphate decarboxylase
MTDHGGNIYEAARRTGIPERKIIDFSASINPLGVPKSAAHAITKVINRLYHYPEPYAERLSIRIADTIGVPAESIICGNGSTELIYLIPRALRPAKVLIPEPTFLLYEKACRTSGVVHVVDFPLEDKNSFDLSPKGFIQAILSNAGGDLQTMSSDDCASVMAFLCNPNNPTGRLVSRDDVLRIAEAAARSGCNLVVDEAFMDFCPEESVCKEVAHNPYLIVLRSMTKFYALSGLRIGYGVFHPSIASRIREHKEPWTVNSLAQGAAMAVLDDEPYQRASLDVVAQEKSFLENGFAGLGIPFLSSQANYYLIRPPKARQIRLALEEKGILVRDCSNFRGLDENYLRVAVRSRKENTTFLRELAKICARLS